MKAHKALTIVIKLGSSWLFSHPLYTLSTHSPLLTHDAPVLPHRLHPHRD
jgi:hypothetical protein